MAYYPKSQILVKNTPGGKLVYKSDRAPYTGDYLEISDGTYFAGNDKVNPGKELILASEDGSKIGTSINSKIYNILNENYFSTLKQYKPLPTDTPKPKETDYERGKYTRYFARKSNNPLAFFEITKETYESLVSKKTEFDVNLFKPGNIEWDLGSNSFEINTRALKIYEDTYPGISKFFFNPKQFSRNLVR